MEEKFLPKVKDCSVFKEVALNTVNQLEILREAISNADDANADEISITIERDFKGEFILTIEDNGDGMGIDDIHKFFNLGFSHKDCNKIGEKGLGTKIFYKSSGIYIETSNKENEKYIASINNPWDILEEGRVPEYEVKDTTKSINKGTKVVIRGYKVDNPEIFFNINTIKDYLQWFTIAGSFRNIFASFINVKNLVNNIDVAPRIIINDKINNVSEVIVGIHQFEEPNENPEIDLNESKYKQSKNYSRPFGPFSRDTNINGEYVSVQIYGTVSGINAREKICKLTDEEAHKSRFGVYLCKDFIPCIRMNSLLHSEKYYHYHIMANSQNFNLTSDRNNISNIDDIKVKWVLNQIEDIINNQIKPLAEKEYFNLIKKEEEDYEAYKRCETMQKSMKKINRLENLNIYNCPLVKKPKNEFETALLLVAMLSDIDIRECICDIGGIVSYSLKSSTDMICLDKDGNYILVEVEFRISNFFRHNHPIDTVDYIVCWVVDIETNRPYQINDKSCVFVDEDENKYLRFSEKIIKIIELSYIVDYIIDKSCIKC